MRGKRLSLYLFSAVVLNFWIPSSGGAATAIPAKYFGMHIHRTAGSTPWPQVSFGSWRLWDAYVAWPHLEPQKGKWNFAKLDAYVNLANSHGVEILLPLGLSPSWVSARPSEHSAYSQYNMDGVAAEPKDIQEWKSYVRTVATRYKGKIRYYEIWNEPNLKQFFSGDMDDLIVLVRSAREILKSVDPAIQVVSPSPTGKDGVKWLEKFLAKGGGNYVDVIGYHFYVTPDPPESMARLVLSVKNIMKSYSINKPLWTTETGWDNRASLTEEEGAGYLARAYILNWTSGSERFYWYSWDNKGWVGIRLTKDDDTTVTPAAIAYREIQSWLVGRAVDGCSRGAGGLWTCSVSDTSGKVGEILWSDSVATTIPRSSKPAYAVIAKLDGSSRTLKSNDSIAITGSPVFLHVKGAAKAPRPIKKNDDVIVIQDRPLVY